MILYVYIIKVITIVTVVLYLFRFFVIKQVHTHPVVTSTSSTTERPNRTPRALLVVEILLFNAVLDDNGCSVFEVVKSKETVGDCGQGKLVVTIMVCSSIVVTIMVHWLGEIVGETFTVVECCGSVTFKQ